MPGMGMVKQWQTIFFFSFDNTQGLDNAGNLQLELNQLSDRLSDRTHF